MIIEYHLKGNTVLHTVLSANPKSILGFPICDRLEKNGDKNGQSIIYYIYIIYILYIYYIYIIYILYIY